MARRHADTASILSQQTSNSSHNPRSIYSRGPDISLDTFASKEFIVTEFVESLSKAADQSARRSYDNRSAGRSANTTDAFDPKPYIRTYEHALGTLGQLSDQRESHESELSLAVRRAEAAHRNYCSELQRKLDQALENFRNLERRLENTLDQGAANETNGEHAAQVKGYGSSTRLQGALHVGERLQELDRQRRRAEDAKYLILCWQDVSQKGDLSRLEEQRRLGGPQGKVDCAKKARQLLKISEQLHEDEQPNGVHFANGVNGNGPQVNGDHSHQDPRETNEIIERFLERLETDLLEQFESLQKQHNERGQRDCAEALYDFNEGASIIARYVNAHSFFSDQSRLMSDPVTDDRDLWDRLADPDAEQLSQQQGFQQGPDQRHPNLEPSLQSLAEDASYAIEDESLSMKRIFPYAEEVLIVFLQRVFQQTIQQRLEAVLEKAASVSALAFLRTLQAARTVIGAMVERLKAHGLTEHPETVSPSVAALLDQQLEDLFVPYVAGASYIERERDSLEELYASLLYRFTLYHSRRRKNPSSYIGTFSQRGRELLSSARDLYTDRLYSSDLGVSQKATLLRLAGMRDTDHRSQATEMEVSDQDGALSLPMAQRMLNWLAEAVGRGLELSGGPETPKDVSIMLRLVLVNLGDIYLETSLDTAAEMALSQDNVKNEPDMSFIPDLRTAISILVLELKMINAVLLPLATPNVTMKREMEKLLTQSVSRMEDKISTIRTRIIDVALNWVAKLLARQNRTDFRPRDDSSLGLEPLQTPTCQSIFVFLVRVRDLMLNAEAGGTTPTSPTNSMVGAAGGSALGAAGKTGSKNLETFFTDLALGFRTLLFEHFKKFQVNLAGGLMVSKDITKYTELLRSFPLAPNFMPSLEVLQEVANLFVIGPEALKDRLRGGGALMGVDKADLRPYILRREDVNTVGVQSVLNAL